MLSFFGKLFNFFNINNTEGPSPEVALPNSPDDDISPLGLLIFSHFYSRCRHTAGRSSEARNKTKPLSRADSVNVVLVSAPYDMQPYHFVWASVYKFRDVLMDIFDKGLVKESVLNNLAVSIAERWITINHGVFSIDSANYVSRRDVHQTLLTVKSALAEADAKARRTFSLVNANAAQGNMAVDIHVALFLELFDLELFKLTPKSGQFSKV